MIKCLECGFETEKLQWTHFKFKCTGRFKNCKEYKEVYPNAPLTDPKLKAKYKITEDSLREKYGEEEGKRRWDSYREKQAVSNSFEYKKEKYGWTKEQFNEYNSSRAQTLEKMILRHGEQEGNIKWLNYCERQAYTNSKEYFIEKYGHDKGNKKYLEINKLKGYSNDPKRIAEDLNITVDEAVEVIISRNVRPGNTWGSDLEKDFTMALEQALGFSLEYSTFSKPFGKWSHHRNGYVVFDIKHNDCIIEFNGDYWHANPKIYKDDAVIRGKKASYIQERDRLKLLTASELGYRTLTVWEKEYNENKENIINEVVRWMQNGQK
jgi:hypothetical protein